MREASVAREEPPARDALAVYRDLAGMGSRPALTWYGRDGRIELSGRVAANHMAKIAGYLLDEVWLEPGARLRLALPAHWKQVLWAMGGLLAGAHVECEGVTDDRHEGAAYAVVACDHQRLSDLATSAEADEVLALDLASLATSWTGPPLPAGVRDAAAEVMGAPDALVDEHAHAASNASRWQAADPLHPSAGPLGALLVAPEPELAISAALGLLGRERLVVVDDESQAERIRKAERLERA
ncbi:MAG: TIGR03089 family protein [Actinomycetaceae bacterium]|nr:TIGR03089 family protein [Actinomycetaceae bacterium]